MRTNKFIHLHSKCLAILEMIQAVNNRLSQTKADYHVWQHTGDPYAPIKLFHNSTFFTSRIEKDIKIKDRLIRYYSATILLITEDAIKKCFPVELKKSESQLVKVS